MPGPIGHVGLATAKRENGHPRPSDPPRYPPAIAHARGSVARACDDRERIIYSTYRGFLSCAGLDAVAPAVICVLSGDKRNDIVRLSFWSVPLSYVADVLPSSVA